jgi:choline dehydrogenase-like flavoprotein
LHGHSAGGRIGYLKTLVGASLINNDGATDHAYIPRFKQRSNDHNYVGGFGIQVNFISFRHPHHARSIAGFGSNYKKRVRDLQPALLQLGGFGKVMARRENRVIVDPKKVDQHGIPIPIIQFEFGDNDRALFRNMLARIEEIFHASGVELLLKGNENIGGFASHEVGTCRMGTDPKSSVLNSYCQTHEVKNLFVVDGSCFTTFPEKNPTLTIAALAVRSARYIVREKRKGDL